MSPPTDEEQRGFNLAVRKALEILHGMLVELQKGVHGSADPEVRNSTFHSVIEIRGLIRDSISQIDSLETKKKIDASH